MGCCAFCSILRKETLKERSTTKKKQLTFNKSLEEGVRKNSVVELAKEYIKNAFVGDFVSVM